MPIYIHIYGHTLFDMYMCMGLLSILCTSDQQKRHKLRRGPSTWHNIPTKFGSNSNWLVVPEKKIKMLKFMDDNDRHQVMAIPHMNLWVKWPNNGSNGNNTSDLSVCFNHEYSKTELQNIIWKYRKLHQNQTRIDLRIIVWKIVIFNEIYRNKNYNEDYLLYVSVGTDCHIL